MPLDKDPDVDVTQSADEDETFDPYIDVQIDEDEDRQYFENVGCSCKSKLQVWAGQCSI